MSDLNHYFKQLLHSEKGGTKIYAYTFLVKLIFLDSYKDNIYSAMILVYLYQVFMHAHGFCFQILLGLKAERRRRPFIKP